MRFMIVGSGMQGRACAFDMLQNPDVAEVLLADSSAANLESVSRWLASPRVRTVCADASDGERMRELARGFDTVVSAAPYFLNLGLAKAALAAGCHFVDLGGNTEIVLQELALHDAAVAAGVSIQPDVGLGPGMINTMAAHGISLMDTVDEVLIRDGGLPQTPEPPMSYLLTFSEHGLINEFAENATALRDFKRVEVPALSELEEIDLPELGRFECAQCAGGLATMAYTYEGKVRVMDNKMIRYPGHIGVMNGLLAMGFFDQQPVAFPGGSVSPREMSAYLFRKHFYRPGARDLVVVHITVRGVKDGRPAEVVYDLLDRFDEATGLTAMTRMTGFPVSIVAQMTARGVMRPGAYPVEVGVPPEAFFEEAKRRGFNLTWEFRFLA